MTANRITYRRRHPYNTRSNRTKGVRTPSGKLVCQYLKNRIVLCISSKVSCLKTKITRCDRTTKENKNSFRRQVSRPYGGHLSMPAVRENR
eukprot:UN21658